jgi:murein DD-endopeptidase MepM/ murein hydrolase activator NlpD
VIRLPRARANRNLTVVALVALAASAAPAVAAPDDGGELRVRADLGAMVKSISRAKLPELDAGPFVPVVGKVDYGTVENAFGAARSGHVHAGQDMFAPAGTPLVAVTDAIAIDAGSDGGQGNYVHLYDPKRERTYVYMHMIAPTPLDSGEKVHAGERVGSLGCTGSCWGDHLHFEVREGRGAFTNEAIDPLPLLRDWHSLERPR